MTGPAGRALPRPGEARRVAVEVGATALRIAVDGPGGPVLLADVPSAGPARPAELPAALRALLDAPAGELVLVHPPGWPAEVLAGWVTAAGELADTVATVPVPAAAAGPGHAVLDVGRRAAVACLLGPDGGVRALRRVPAGGNSLDARLARAAGIPPAVRERLSLLPEVAAPGRAAVAEVAVRPVVTDGLRPAVEALRGVLAAGPPGCPVRVIGGVARTPVLAELIDGAGLGPLTVAQRPEAAAVLGALRVPRAALRAWPSAAPAPAVPPRRLPPPSRRRSPAAGVGTALALALLVVAALTVARSPAPPSPPPDVLVQYGYQARIPPGWAHTGGLPAERRSLLTPLGAPAGSDLVTVERAVVGYDTDAERDRARAEVRAAYDAAVAAGARLSGFDPDATLAGRPVTAYRQHGSAGRTVVDWFVVLDGDSQLDVGCQYTRANAAEVARACAVVVGSIRPTS